METGEEKKGMDEVLPQYIVLKIIKDRPIDQISGVVNELAQKFGLHQSTISKLETSEGRVSDVMRGRRHPRDLKIWTLVKLGWTEEKAGGLFLGWHSRELMKLSEI